MRVDAAIRAADLSAVPALARAAEAHALGGVWFNETDGDPFLSAALAAEHTTRLQIGTAIALAFVRSPTSLAYLGWGLARLSAGRFVLGLGSQVRAHVERRFGMPWEPPVARMRDVIGAIRAVWRSWRERAPLRHEGPFYSLSLMTPFFTPPAFQGEIPIYLAAVNPAMCRLAGEIADGLHVHPLHSATYVQEVVLPALDRGLRRSGRRRDDLTVAASVIIVTESGAARDRAVAHAKRTIAFYASTPSYRRILALHGWERVGEGLSRLAVAGRWEEMPALVTDEMLETFAVVADAATVAARLRERAGGAFDRVVPYRAFSPEDALWSALPP
ncbi:MAG TPA: TIGR03617 family F420-dependent LLM class oxidoreductase [bacterium]|nr:TIGR03617 family F420-dependent LLM class oxidoreductase [bacterium]